jgi:hypothetical protein
LKPLADAMPRVSPPNTVFRSGTIAPAVDDVPQALLSHGGKDSAGHVQQAKDVGGDDNLTTYRQLTT